MSGWWPLLLPFAFGAPWIVAIVWYRRHLFCHDDVPPSMAEQARRRLWTS